MSPDRKRIVRTVLLVLGLLAPVPAPAEAAGFQTLEVPAAAGAPPLQGAMWYPCAAAPETIRIGPFAMAAAKGCAPVGSGLPLVVVSHGQAGSAVSHHDTATALADAGFVVAAINHPGDNARDTGRSRSLGVFVERPRDIARLIDFMLTAAPVAGQLDAGRIGFFGFSRGGYTGLVLAGAKPDPAGVRAFCAPLGAGACDAADQLAAGRHEPRIRAAVIADPLAVLFGPDSFAGVRVPVQLWQSALGGDGVAPEQVAEIDRALAAPHELRRVEAAGHFVFLAPCVPEMASAMAGICLDPPGVDRRAVHVQLNADIVEFLRRRLGEP